MWAFELDSPVSNKPEKVIMCDVRVYASISNALAKTFLLLLSWTLGRFKLQKNDRTRNRLGKNIELDRKLCVSKSFAASRVSQEGVD